MALKLYRRHRTECEAELPEDARTGQFEENRRGWKRCACLIHAAGTLGGQFNRRQTGKTDWDEAKAVAAQWEAVGSWDGKPKSKPEPARAPASRRITINDAIKVFLTLREGDKIAPATLRKYKTFTKQLLAFAESRGYVVLDQFTSAAHGRAADALPRSGSPSAPPNGGTLPPDTFADSRTALSSGIWG